MTFLKIGQTQINLDHVTSVDLEACVAKAGEFDRPTAVRFQFSNGRERHFHGAEADGVRAFLNAARRAYSPRFDTHAELIDLTPPTPEPAP